MRHEAHLISKEHSEHTLNFPTGSLYKQFAAPDLDLIPHRPVLGYTPRNAVKRAAVRRVQRSAWAAVGHQLFGLKKVPTSGEEVPEIYTDKIFDQTSHWGLSTSQLSSRLMPALGTVFAIPLAMTIFCGLLLTRNVERRSWDHYLAEAATT